MSEVATLSADFVANDKISKFLDQLEARLDRLNKRSTTAPVIPAPNSAPFTKSTKQATDATLTLAQAQARLQATSGNTQGAFQTLSAALATNSGSQLQNIRASTQLAQIQNRLSGQSQSLTSLFGQMGGQLSQLGGAGGQAAGALGSLAGSLGTVGAIGAALSLGKVAFDLGVAGANADLVRIRFDQLAVAAGTTGQAMLQALRAASGGEISDLNLELAANRANLLGVADSAEEMAVLLAIARDRAQQLGTSSAKAFDDLVTGLGRGSPLILDNLGIMVSVKEANDAYAASIGTVADKLTEAQQKQALINAVLAQGRASIAATGGAVNSAAGAIAQAQTTIANTASAAGSLISDVFLGPLAENFNKTAEATQSLTTWLASLGMTSASAAAEAQAQVAATNAYTAELERSGSVIQANAAFEAAHALSLQQSAQAAGASVGPMAAAAAGQQALGAAAQAATQAQQQLTSELGTNAEAAVLAAAKQDAQAQATANLKAQTDQAVQAFLDLNPSIDGAGIAAAVAAGKIPALIGQLAAMRVAAYSARDAMAALAAQQAINTKSLVAPGGVGVNAPGRTSGRNNDINAVLSLQKANQEAADARSAQIIAIGNDQQKLNELERQYGAAVKASGADSAAAIQAETRLKQERAAQIKNSTKTAKAGGAAKVSDQQKLNNTLLASQDQYAQKAEDAEEAHLDKVLQINRDFAEKLKKAQDSFAQSQLDGRAGFYDTLGSIEDAGLRQSLAAQYEAAFAEADAIAREKGADVGQKFLEARQAAIQAQGQRASEIAEATKAGDKDKAEYLAGVDKLYRDAEARKLEAIKAGEGSIQGEQAAALTEEGARYAEAQAKIGDSADQAAQRKILAAERAGKAIDAEALKVDGLAAKYDSLAMAGSRAGVTAAPTGTGVPTPATVPAAPGESAVVVALNAAQAAIVAALGSVVNAERDTAGAVRSLNGKFAS